MPTYTKQIMIKQLKAAGYMEAADRVLHMTLPGQTVATLRDIEMHYRDELPGAAGIIAEYRRQVEQDERDGLPDVPGRGEQIEDDSLIELYEHGAQLLRCGDLLHIGDGRFREVLSNAEFRDGAVDWVTVELSDKQAPRVTMEFHKHAPVRVRRLGGDSAPDSTVPAGVKPQDVAIVPVLAQVTASPKSTNGVDDIDGTITPVDGFMECDDDGYTLAGIIHRLFQEGAESVSVDFSRDALEVAEQDAVDALEAREEAARAILEDRVPTDELQRLVATYGADSLDDAEGQGRR